MYIVMGMFCICMHQYVYTREAVLLQDKHSNSSFLVLSATRKLLAGYTYCDTVNAIIASRLRVLVHSLLNFTNV